MIVECMKHRNEPKAVTSLRKVVVNNENNKNLHKNIESISMKKLNHCVYTRLKYNFTFEWK